MPTTGSSLLVPSIATCVLLCACISMSHGPDDAHPEGRLTSDRELREVLPAPSLDDVPKGPFGLSMVASSDGEPVAIEDFEPNEYCGECHERQYQELMGSMHSISHTDSLYRSAAEMALREAGPEVYALCAGCHTAQGVASGLVPSTPEEDLPAVVKAGVICDTCHHVESLTGASGPWGEPGNASIVLAPDIDRKFGPPTGDDDVATHTVETREFLSSSEFCASCHTVIHPFNGVRLEHTYAEWLASPYADAGIQCQDCHMRTPEEAAQVAREMRPVEVLGLSEPSGETRPIARHYFVGANTNAVALGGGEEHAHMARKRLESAASVDIAAPTEVSSGDMMEIGITVTNVAAGHSLPTSLVELRRVWVDLRVVDGSGQEIFRSGWLDPTQDVGDDVMRFGALAGNADGQPTYKPWEVTHFLWKRLIPPKSSEADVFRVRVPESAAGLLTIRARLFYRSAPEHAARAIMGDRYVELETVEMASASAVVEVRG